jgi:hypothetical protein
VDSIYPDDKENPLELLHEGGEISGEAPQPA